MREAKVSKNWPMGGLRPNVLLAEYHEQLIGKALQRWHCAGSQQASAKRRCCRTAYEPAATHPDGDHATSQADLRPRTQPTPPSVCGTGAAASCLPCPCRALREFQPMAATAANDAKPATIFQRNTEELAAGRSVLTTALCVTTTASSGFAPGTGVLALFAHADGRATGWWRGQPVQASATHHQPNGKAPK